MNKKHLYSYFGPVTSFGKVIEPRWHGSTYAVSKEKAKSNLIYRFKTLTKRVPGSQIELPEKIILVK